MIKKDNGKEYMAKLPYAFPARKGHTVIAADFRGSTIAAANNTTDAIRGTINVVRGHLKERAYIPRSSLKFFYYTIGTICLFGLLLGGPVAFIHSTATGWIYVGVMIGLMNLVARPMSQKEKLIHDVDKELPNAAIENLRALLARPA